MKLERMRERTPGKELWKVFIARDVPARKKTLVRSSPQLKGEKY